MGCHDCHLAGSCVSRKTEEADPFVRFVPASRLRAAEEAAFASGALDPFVAMTRAGLALAREVRLLAAAAGPHGSPLAFYCGAGNNGGDGFVAARALSAEGLRPLVFFAGKAEKLPPPAARAFAELRDAGVEVVPVGEDAPFVPPAGGVAVDCLLGSGAHGPLRGAVRRVAEALRASDFPRRLVVACDIPSGLDAETGELAGDGVYLPADLTVTMARPFSAMLLPASRDVCGSLRVADIGLPPDALAADEEGPALLTARAAEVFSCRRPHAAHKGAFGFLWAAAGSDAYPGAGVLAARGAAKSGVGLLAVRAEGARAFALAAAVPTAMPVPGDEPPARATAALVGPGLVPDEAERVARKVLASPLACVLDAGALGAWTLAAVAQRPAGTETVLTPHEGELARMLSLDVEAVKEDRAAAALAAAQEARAVVVAKGAGTLVATPEGDVFLNRTGNPGMANGGSGDVLAGFLAGLLARAPMGGKEAACAAVHVHGVAGDLAAAAAGENSLDASRLAPFLRL